MSSRNIRAEVGLIIDPHRGVINFTYLRDIDKEKLAQYLEGEVAAYCRMNGYMVDWINFRRDVYRLLDYYRQEFRNGYNIEIHVGFRPISGNIYATGSSQSSGSIRLDPPNNLPLMWGETGPLSQIDCYSAEEKQNKVLLLL